MNNISNSKKNDISSKIQIEDFKKCKGGNPVYESWIKKINSKDKLPRGKYFRRKYIYIIDVDPVLVRSIMNKYN